jgi:uncharacterized membrane protein YccF (DUF307 family)
VLRVIANVIWLVVAGLPLAITYVLFGLLACVFIVTIPFGVASFRLANYALWPFGRTVVQRSSVGAASTAANVVWFVVAGFWLAVGQVLAGLALCLTIIGIPFGIQCFKMAGLALFPLGKEIVPIDRDEYATSAPVAARYGL